MNDPFLQRALRMLDTSVASLALFAGLCAPAFAVNKCTSDSGAVTFQEAACPNSAKTKEAVKVWGQDPMLSGSRGQLPRLGSDNRATLVQPLDYSGTRIQKVRKASAALDTLADMARDCKIDLKVYGPVEKALGSCGAFGDHANAWHKAALLVLTEAAGDSDFKDENHSLLSRSLRRHQQIEEDTQIILLRFKTAESAR